MALVNTIRNKLLRVRLLYAQSLTIADRVIVEGLPDEIFEWLFCCCIRTCDFVILWGPYVILVSWTRLQIMKGRIVIGFVTKLLDDQLSHGAFDFLDVYFDIIDAVFDNLVILFLLFNFISCNVLGPFLSLSVQPLALFNLQTILLGIIYNDVEADSVLLSSLPLSIIGSTISPEVDAVTTLLVVNILSHKHPSITPFIRTFSVHHIIFPVAKEQTIIVPYEEALSVKHVATPFADKAVTVWPAVLSLTLFGRILIEALILAAIVPLFFAETMLFVLVPISDIFTAVGMSVDAEALGHIVDEFSFIQIATGMIEFTTTVVKIVFPQSFVNCTVWPSHDAVPLLDILTIFEHLARIDGAFFTVLVYPHFMDVHEVARLKLFHLFLHN